MKIIGSILLSFIILIVGGCMIASLGMKSKPGYADVELPDLSMKKMPISLSIGPYGLKPIHWIASPMIKSTLQDAENSSKTIDKEELALTLLDNLDGIRLRVYKSDDDLDSLNEAIKRSQTKLKNSGWETIITVNDEHEKILIMTKTDSSDIVGLSIFTISDGEVVFINLMGRIQPKEMAFVTKSLQNTET